jgi:primosomal protein N' (replication factor Y)
MSKYYQIAVNFPGRNSILTYMSKVDLKRGDLVEVPLGKRKSKGIILGEASPKEIKEASQYQLKEIDSIIENSVGLSENELELYKWTASYYHYSLGKLIFDSLPKILKRPRKVDFIEGRGNQFEGELTHEQDVAYRGIAKKLIAKFSQHYVHGITGSGKSIVFLKLIQDTIKSGKSAQFLLPEINLTPQFIELFSNYLDCKILTYHSAITASEKYTIWKTLHDLDEPVLVMGVRSSVYLPLKNLGLIVIDEEHDHSFKQSDRCPYNGRDVAIKKASLHECPVVLGSATPSLENFYLFKNEVQNRHYYAMKNRAMEATLPKLLIEDSRENHYEGIDSWPLLPKTIEAIKGRLENSEQVLVFINKLGFSHFVQCRSCGHRFINEKCGCDNNLRYFKKKNLLSCAHCEYKEPLPKSCPECGNMALLQKGFGTEKVLEVLQDFFPQNRLERFDRDEITNLNQLKDKLERFHSGDIDLLVGTQMLAKGHNFKKVNLVVILGVDSQISSPDFRASERLYQLVNQVSGRAGRYSDHGEVIIQTMSPSHNVFNHMSKHDFDEFYQGELSLRELCDCPPFTKLGMIYFSSRFRDRAIQVSAEVAEKLKTTFMNDQYQLKIMGPVALTIEKKSGQYSWAIMLKSQNPQELHTAISTFESNYRPISNVSYKIDIDPYQIL